MSTYVVNSTGNDNDANRGDNVCETATGNGVRTLRAAITEADNHAADAEIQFNIPASDPNCDAAGNCVIPLPASLPLLAANISIKGPDAKKLTVSRASTTPFSIFGFDGLAGSISGLTIRGGHNPADGGAVSTVGTTLNLSDCVFLFNTAAASATRPRATSSPPSRTALRIDSASNYGLTVHQGLTRGREETVSRINRRSK